MRKRKKRDTSKRRTETALKWILYPPAIAGAILFGSSKNNRKKRGKKK